MIKPIRFIFAIFMVLISIGRIVFPYVIAPFVAAVTFYILENLRAPDYLIFFGIYFSTLVTCILVFMGLHYRSSTEPLKIDSDLFAAVFFSTILFAFLGFIAKEIILDPITSCDEGHLVRTPDGKVLVDPDGYSRWTVPHEHRKKLFGCEQCDNPHPFILPDEQY